MQAELKRLVRLVGTDAGFYVLALHSFVEHYIRDIAQASDSEKFPDIVWDFRERLIEQSEGGFVQGLNCLASFGRQHRFTNSVRHAFWELDPDEAVAATHLFLVFCTLIGIGSMPEVRRLERSREVWRERRSLAEQSGVLHSVQEELKGLQARNRDLLAQLDGYEIDARKVAQLEHEIDRFTLELKETRGRAKVKDRKVDELRAERARLREERKGLLKQMQAYEELERYIGDLGRFSIYTKTRMDYERTLLRLTPEQEEAVQAIDRESDFLVRGSAGTGKSLILIEALQRSLEIGELPFDARPDQRAVLLTFTRTLAKFEDYVTTVLGADRISGLVKTVDAFILERLKRIDESYRFDFTIVDELCAELNTTEFLDDVEVAAELETFLFGNVVTHEEYTNEVVPRMGMRRRLSRGQRETVWAIRDQVVSRMNDIGAFSRNYARIKILDYIEAGSEEDRGRLRDVRTIYLDETQDLTSGDLITLKALISGHLIMASDLQQSIYGVSSPFVRAGIRISGRTKVLRTNFRNTRQIHEAAQRFQPTNEENLFAFRDGPIPELYTAGEPAELLPILLRKLGLFLDHLEYDADNICVLAPHTAEVSHIAEALAQHDIPAAVITDREFQFSATGAVRLSTLHSSKGLDFPVVLVYLPYLNRREKFDEETTDRLLRNLIYVGFTRAMENLNVFACPGQDPILNDVCRALELTPDSAAGAVVDG
ncbi:MAG: AAA family ATPase [Spirochaetales bacterium]|nr:AAA family ATPase [Spirochaetales bacterium]